MHICNCAITVGSVYVCIFRWLNAATNILLNINYRSSQVRLGKNGVEEVLGLGPLSDFEKEGLESLKPELKASIEKGIKFANQS